MGLTPVILSGAVVIQNDPDTNFSDPGSLTVSQYGVFGTYATVGTSLSVGTTITANGLITGPYLNLLSTTSTSTFAGPLSFTNTVTSTSSASFLSLNTTSSTVANTFNNPSTFLSSLTGTSATFSSSLTAAFFNGTSSTLASTLQGPLTVASLTTSSTSATNTINGPLSLTNTLSSTSTATFAGLLTANNRIVTNEFTNTGTSTLGGQVNYPNTYYTLTTQNALPTSQGGTGIPGNTWRFRTNDATNTAVRMSLGNAGLGNTYYNTNLSVYGLGVLEGTTGNSERLTIGYNGATGPYINQQFLGTGIARSLNIYNGALFSDGGALSLASTLGVAGSSALNGPVLMTKAMTVLGTSTLTGAASLGSTLAVTSTSTLNGNVTINATTSSTTSSTGALVVVGGAGIGGNIVSNGTLACANINDFGSLIVQGTASFQQTLNLAYLTTQPATPATGDTFFVNNTGLLQSIGMDGMLTTYQPMTSLGDLVAHNGVTQTRLPKGADNTALIADSTAAVGVSWQTITRNNVIIGNTSTVPVPKYLSKFYTGTTGNNGQVLIYPNSNNNNTTGVRIFQSITAVYVFVTGNNGSMNAQNAYWGAVQSANVNVCDCRVMTGTTIGTLLLSVNPTVAYAPSGVAVTVEVKGVPL